jgi:hypothetical protein
MWKYEEAEIRLMNKKTVLLKMLCDKEPLEAIERSFDSMLAQSGEADIDILDNSGDPEIHAFFASKMSSLQGYHATPEHWDYASAFRASITSNGNPNYQYFIAVQPGDELPKGHAARCDEIMTERPLADVLLFCDDLNMERFHGKIVPRQDCGAVYEYVATNHGATISRACVRTDISYGNCLSLPTVQGIAWAMLLVLCKFNLAVWNRDAPRGGFYPPDNPFFHLLGHYERLASLEVPYIKNSYIGEFEACGQPGMKALSIYAIDMAERLADVGRLHDAQNCWLFAPVAWPEADESEKYTNLGRRLWSAEPYNNAETACVERGRVL